jgi:cell division protein FtsL
MTRSGTKNESHALQKLAKWPVFLIANASLLLVVGVSTVRETYLGWTVDREIHALEAQASTLEGRKMQLQSLADELVSPDRVEYDARARLELKKPGERVVILQGVSSTSTWSGTASGWGEKEGGTTLDVRSNPERWKDYFFKN